MKTMKFMGILNVKPVDPLPPNVGLTFKRRKSKCESPLMKLFFNTILLEHSV